MNKFFDLEPEEQVEEILSVIEENKRKRTPLIKEIQFETDPFTDIYWKHREVLENSNPIPVPENVRLRFIKRVIGKLIRTYTRKQVHFNQSATSFMELVIKHLKNLDGKINGITSKLEDQNDLGNRIIDKINHLDSDIQGVQKNVDRDIRELREKNNAILDFTEERLSETKTEMVSGNFKLENKINNTREWLSGLEQTNDNLNKWIEIIDKRVLALEEFQHRTRKEIYAELKHISGSDFLGKNTIQTSPEIINKAKVNQFITQGLVKVNLGCGHIPKEDYLNVDMRELDGVDIIADVRKVPFETESIDELYLAHVIEHFTEVDMEAYILPYWHSLLKPGGKITIICPNWNAMLDEYAKGKVSFEVLKEITFGSQEYEGNQHYNMFSPQSLTKLLDKIGFKNVRTVDEYRINGLCIEMEIEGVR
ncbi:hypothetical protein D3C74_176040 [compost metagenome]